MQLMAIIVKKNLQQLCFHYKSNAQMLRLAFTITSHTHLNTHMQVLIIIQAHTIIFNDYWISVRLLLDDPTACKTKQTF